MYVDDCRRLCKYYRYVCNSMMYKLVATKSMKLTQVTDIHNQPFCYNLASTVRTVAELENFLGV